MFRVYAPTYSESAPPNILINDQVVLSFASIPARICPN
nr:MAG TPA: hypothetical protein [Caudoviricetes sp.]